MIRPATILALLLCAATAQAWQYDLELRGEVFTDNDAGHSFTFDEVVHRKDAATRFGVGATQTILRESSSNRHFVGGLLEGYHRRDNLDFTARLKLIDWGDEFATPLTLAASQQIGALRLEENLDYGTVDTVKAFDAEIDFWSAGGGAEYALRDDLNLSAYYWRRWSSDDNRRGYLVLRGTYDLNETFHLQYRYRDIRNADQVPEYYSPEHFTQHAALFGYYAALLDRVRLKVWLGPVVQDDGFETSLGLLEDVRLTCRFDDNWSLAGRIEADQVGNGYEYVYATVSLVYDF